MGIYNFILKASKVMKVCVMKSHGKAMYLLRIKKAKRSKVENITDKSENWF